MTYFTLCLSFFLFLCFFFVLKHQINLGNATFAFGLGPTRPSFFLSLYLSVSASPIKSTSLSQHQIHTKQNKTEAKRRQRAEGLVPFTSLCLFFILHHHFISPLSLFSSLVHPFPFILLRGERQHNYSISITISIISNNCVSFIPIYLSVIEENKHSHIHHLLL